MYSMDFAQVGANIQKEIRLKGMTQQSLADSLGISKQVMNKIIKGSKAININELARIAETLNVSTDYLLTVEEEPVKEEVKAEEPEKPFKKAEKKPERKTEKKHESFRKPVREEKPEVKSEPKKEVELAKVEPQTIETCEKFIYDVMNAMGMDDVKVTSVVDEEGALAINMEGSNMGILIGKRGQTLDSLQYLTNRVANKMQDGYVRVKLDTEDYRRRRKETLENLAKNIASKVKRTRKTVSLEPMNPYERRIIHSALQSDPAVSTHSEGEEPYRRVVVTLVRNRNNR